MLRNIMVLICFFIIISVRAEQISIQSSLDNIERYREYNALTIQPNNVLIANAANQLGDKKHEKKLSKIPYVAKDNILTKEYPTSNGVKNLETYSKREDAKIIKILDDAGAILMGKANMHEFAGGVTSVNHDYGPVKNPKNPMYFSGGSSGGSASAVALRMAEFSIGSDTSGSVRIPASLCGVVGFRPTTHRYPKEGLFPLSTSLDALGIFANDVATIKQIDKVIVKNKNTCGLDRKLRLGLPTNHFFNDLNPIIKEKFVDVMAKLYHDGHEFVEIEITPINQIFHLSSNIIYYEGKRAIPTFLRDNYSDISLKKSIEYLKSPIVKQILNGMISFKLSEKKYNKLQKDRERFKNWYIKAFEDYRLDAIVYPATKDVALKIETEINSELINYYLSNTLAASLAEMPSISLPLGTDLNQLPFGLGIDGQYNQDECLLEVADYIFKNYL